MKQEKKYNKMKSRRLWVTVYCAALVGYIVVRNLSDMAGIGAILAGAVVAYIGIESYNKPKFNQDKEIYNKYDSL
ncbi:MAG TPA: hypothetical protein DCO75_02140 [Fibrobacteres bacterium]|jgi:hypothetical protein|nr:hypothetical protein [Fibrobacterota bacterium]